MTKRKQSASSPRASKRSSKRSAGPKRNLGEEMIRALEEGIAHVQGKIKLRTRTIVVPDAVISETIDVHAIREKSGLSQSEFAARYGFRGRTLQEWEQGRARPDGAVRPIWLVLPQMVRADLRVKRFLANCAAPQSVSAGKSPPHLTDYEVLTLLMAWWDNPTMI